MELWFSYFGFFMLGFSWQIVHCRQWTWNHQRWASSVTQADLPERGHSSLREEFVQKGDSHYLYGCGNKDRMVYLGSYFVFPPHLLSLSFLRKWIDNMFPLQLFGAIEWLTLSWSFVKTWKSNIFNQVKI